MTADEKQQIFGNLSNAQESNPQPFSWGGTVLTTAPVKHLKKNMKGGCNDGQHLKCQ